MTPYHYLQKSQIIDSISYRYQTAAYLKAEKALGSISQPRVHLRILCHLTTKVNQLVGDMSAIEILRELFMSKMVSTCYCITIFKMICL